MNAQFYYERGLKRLNSRHYEGSLWNLERAIELDAAFADAYLAKAEVCSFFNDSGGDSL